jgi:hypothetical protein
MIHNTYFFNHSINLAVAVYQPLTYSDNVNADPKRNAKTRGKEH